DGNQEYVMGDGSGYLHAFTKSGKELPGFPVLGVASRYSHLLPVPAGAGFYAAVAVGDITGDGFAEIVGATLEGHVVAVDRLGRSLPGFPKTIPLPDMSAVNRNQVIAKGIGAAPVIVDMNR